MRHTLLLSRPWPASHRFHQALLAAGVDLPVCISPVIEIAATGVSVPGLENFLFTSEHGVRFAGAARGRAWVVGPQTAQAARAAGFDVAAVAEDAEALVTAVLAQPPQGPAVHVHGAHSRGDVAARLTAAGVPVAESVVYRQDACAPSDAARRLWRGADPLIVPLFSPRSAALLADHLGPPDAPCSVVALSAAVAQAWPFASAVAVAAEKTGSAMIAAVSHLANG